MARNGRAFVVAHILAMMVGGVHTDSMKTFTGLARLHHTSYSVSRIGTVLYHRSRRNHEAMILQKCVAASVAEAAFQVEATCKRPAALSPACLASTLRAPAPTLRA